MCSNYVETFEYQRIRQLGNFLFIGINLLHLYFHQGSYIYALVCLLLCLSGSRSIEKVMDAFYETVGNGKPRDKETIRF